jgi:hypothetical protein
MTRIDWASVLIHAATLIRTYDTGVTVRQLFDRLVADGTLPNTSTAHKHLSATTAEARRRGAFPDLVDLTRTIHRPLGFKGPEEAMGYLDVTYRRDRTEYMDRSVYLGVEKAGLVAQLEAWFGERGLPVLALSGFASESYVRQVVYDIRMWRRPAILLYAGDFDASGEDISRDFATRTGCWDKVQGRAHERAGQGVQPSQGGREGIGLPRCCLRGAARRTRAGRTGRAAPECAAEPVRDGTREVLGRVRIPAVAEGRAAGSHRAVRDGRAMTPEPRQLTTRLSPWDGATSAVDADTTPTSRSHLHEAPVDRGRAPDGGDR